MDLAQPTPAPAPATPAPAAPVAQPAPAPATPAPVAIPTAAPSPVSVSLDLRGLVDASRPAPAVAPVAPAAPAAPAVPPSAPPADAAPAAPPPAPASPAATPDTDAAAEVAKLRAQIRAKDIAATVATAARVLNVVDPDALHKLVADHLTTDDRGNVVVIANPTESPADYLARFCATRPYLLAPRMQPGAGAPPVVTPPAPPAPAPAINTAQGATAHLHGLLAQRADAAVGRFGGIFGPRPAPAPPTAPAPTTVTNMTTGAR